MELKVVFYYLISGFLCKGGMVFTNNIPFCKVWKSGQDWEQRGGVAGDVNTLVGGRISTGSSWKCPQGNAPRSENRADLGLKWLERQMEGK